MKILSSRVCLITIALLLGSSWYPAQANPAWFWQHPYPTSFFISSIDFIDSETGWFVTWFSGTIFHTLDGGNTWELQGWGYYDLRGVSAVDPMNVWVCGDDGLILHSGDGGMTWTEQQSGTSSRLLSIEFIDQNYGTAVGGAGTIVRTNNGGATWNIQGTPYTGGIRDVCFVSSTHGWVLGCDSNVLHTETAGAFWEIIPTPVTCYFNGGICFTDDSTGWIAGDDGIAYTTDGGDNWSIQYSGDAKLTDIEVTSSGIGIASSNLGYGRILFTDDWGNSWQLEELTGESDPLSVSVPCDTTFYAGGSYGNIYRRISTGEWDLLTDRITDNNITSVCCTDEYNIWACGSASTILNSSNGGVDWSIQYPPRDNLTLNDIIFIDNSIGYTCGYDETEERGVILRTLNGGSSWEDNSVFINPEPDKLLSIDFSDQNRGVTVGLNGEILYTVNGGDTWMSKNNLTLNDLFRVDFADYHSGYVSGESGTMIKFDFSSDSWSEQYSNTNADLWSLCALNDSTAWAAGWNGTIVRTENGSEWSEIAVTGRNYHDIWFADTQNGYLATDNDYSMEVTSNGGYTVNSVDFGIDEYVREFCFLDEFTAWGCGVYSNTIFHFFDSQTFIEHGETQLPEEQMISISNHPNPFLEISSVDIQLLTPGKAVLRLYDLSGRMIMTLYDGYLGAGIHSYILDGNHLSPGIYFFQLTLDSGISTRRCLKL